MSLSAVSMSAPNLNPLLRKPAQPNASALYFGAERSADRQTDTLEIAANSPKTPQEIEKEAELVELRQMAEEAIQQKYSEAQLLDEKGPPPQKAYIDEQVKKFAKLLKDNKDTLKAIELIRPEKAAVREALKELKHPSNVAEKTLYEKIYKELRNIEHSNKLSRERLQGEAMKIEENAFERPASHKENLIQKQIKLYQYRNQPGWISQKSSDISGYVGKQIDNTWYGAKDLWHNSMDTVQYGIIRGLRNGQDLSALAGSGYIGYETSNALNLSFPYSAIPPVMAVAATPFLTSQQKNAIGGGAFLYGASQYAAEPLNSIGKGASAVVAATGIISPSAALNAGSQAVGFVATPFVKAYSVLPSFKKATPASAEEVKERLKTDSKPDKQKALQEIDSKETKADEPRQDSEQAKPVAGIREEIEIIRPALPKKSDA